MKVSNSTRVVLSQCEDVLKSRNKKNNKNLPETGNRPICTKIRI